MEIGTKVHAIITATDSVYAEVIGTVTGPAVNGFLPFEATRVLIRGEAQWKNHPTSCRMRARVTHVRAA